MAATMTGLNGPITANDAERGEPLTFPTPKPAGAQPTFTVSCTVNGFPVTVQFQGDAKKLLATIDRLREIGAEAPAAAQPASVSHEQEYTPDGRPICKRHGAPMKKRERQGDTWFSHAVAEDDKGNPIYCKGYQGKDSPGWEL